MLHRLIHHLDTTSIAEIVVRLVGAEEQTGMYLAPTQARAAACPACVITHSACLLQPACTEQERWIKRRTQEACAHGSRRSLDLSTSFPVGKPPHTFVSRFAGRAWQVGLQRNSH